MAYLVGQRHQGQLLPQRIEDYVPEDAPVRAYDAFVEALDLAALGLAWEPAKVGAPAYDPRAMLKLLVYGYSYGLRSSRKLERECHYNLSFIWLTGGLRPDHKTIAEFRRRHKKALATVLKQCARLCLKLGLIAGNTFFVDGSKVRANAGIGNTWDAKRCQKRLAKLDERIAEILAECDATDRNEKDDASLVHLQEQLADEQTLRAKVAAILEQIQSQEKPSLNITDPDCTKIHSRQGSHAGYNVQTVVDEQQGLIVSSDVVNDNNDCHQFAAQIEQAQETLGRPCQSACADSGYCDVEELAKIDAQGVNVVVPTQEQAANQEPGPFHVSRFTYDPEDDCFICPAGQRLKYVSTESKRRRKNYLAVGSVCRACCSFGVCTTNGYGRKVTRLFQADLREKLRRQYEQPVNQAVYQRRKERAELPFGHIKHNLKCTSFSLRGLEGVKAEASLLATCFNMARMISLLGVAGLIGRLSG